MAETIDTITVNVKHETAEEQGAETIWEIGNDILHKETTETTKPQTSKKNKLKTPPGRKAPPKKSRRKQANNIEDPCECGSKQTGDKFCPDGGRNKRPLPYNQDLPLDLRRLLNSTDPEEKDSDPQKQNKATRTKRRKEYRDSVTPEKKPTAEPTQSPQTPMKAADKTEHGKRQREAKLRAQARVAGPRPRTPRE